MVITGKQGLKAPPRLNRSTVGCHGENNNPRGCLGGAIREKNPSKGGEALRQKCNHAINGQGERQEKETVKATCQPEKKILRKTRLGNGKKAESSQVRKGRKKDKKRGTTSQEKGGGKGWKTGGERSKESTLESPRGDAEVIRH